MSRRNIIKCPNCQQEYLPGEIYYPKEFLGQPKYIVRDIYGCILGNEGIEQNTTETFCCENCNTLFKISAKITFNTEILKTEKDYTTKVTNRLFN